MQLFLFLLAACGANAAVIVEENALDVNANPIRRIVLILQSMTTKIEKERVTEHNLYDKFMCACKTNRAKLSESIVQGQTRVPQADSDIVVSESQLKQLNSQIQTAKDSSAQAEQALVAAKEQRVTANTDYVKNSEELKENLASIAGAIKALEKGRASFLQGELRRPLLKAVESSTGIDDDSRATVTSFLSGEASYAPASGNILGIFKTMQDDMQPRLESLNTDETNQAKMYDDLKAAKTEQVKTLATSIRKKTSQVNDLKVQLVQMKADARRLKEDLETDQKDLSDLNTSCATKEKEKMEREATVQDELLAISDTIKILNSDETLELFKKTLPSSASFLQSANPSTIVRQKRALAAIRAMSHKESLPALGLLSMKLGAKKTARSLALTAVDKSVTDIIDGMLNLMKEEQVNDDAERETCQKRLKSGAAKLRELTRNVKALEEDKAEKKEIVESMAGAIATLTASIKDLDEIVVDATSQRKEEHSAFTEFLAQNNAAKSILGVAKKRLGAFYNKKPEAELQIDKNKVPLSELLPSYRSMALISLTTYESTKSNEIQRMLDKLVNDLDVENAEAEHEEKQSQKDYDKLVEDSKAKRVKDGETLIAKQSIKADAEEAFENLKGSLTAETAQKDAAAAYMPALHKECDWLLSNYRLRETARDEEAAQLKDVKNILAGSGVKKIAFLG